MSWLYLVYTPHVRSGRPCRPWICIPWLRSRRWKLNVLSKKLHTYGFATVPSWSRSEKDGLLVWSNPDMPSRGKPKRCDLWRMTLSTASWTSASLAPCCPTALGIGCLLRNRYNWDGPPLKLPRKWPDFVLEMTRLCVGNYERLPSEGSEVCGLAFGP